MCPQHAFLDDKPGDGDEGSDGVASSGDRVEVGEDAAIIAPMAKSTSRHSRWQPTERAAFRAGNVALSLDDGQVGIGTPFLFTALCEAIGTTS